jgi:hypothetical protein
MCTAFFPFFGLSVVSFLFAGRFSPALAVASRRGLTLPNKSEKPNVQSPDE